MHKTIIIGHLGKDPEITTFEDGGKIAKFSLAATEKGYKTLDGKEIPEHTEWYSCVARKGNATYVSYLKKGNKVYIESRKRSRDYETKDGKKGRSEEFVVDYIENLTPRTEGSAPAQPSPTPNQPKQEEDTNNLPF